MKPLIKCGIVLLASTTAVWADIDLRQFNFTPVPPSRQHPHRSHLGELVREFPATAAPLAVAPRPGKRRVTLAEAPSLCLSDAGTQVSLQPPLQMLPPVAVHEMAKAAADDAEVRADVWVELHETEPGLKLSACDRAIELNYPNPPLKLVCVSAEGVRYVAKSSKTTRDGAYVWNYN